MIDRLLIGSDILMTSEKEQYSNRHWLYKILQFPLKLATEADIVSFSSSENCDAFFSRKEFFFLSDITVDLEQLQFWFDADKISEASINYLRAHFRPGDLFIGYELSQQTRDIFDRIGLTWIDIWLHPIRFLDDILFGFNTSSEAVYAAMRPFHIEEDVFALYARRLQIQTQKGFLRRNPPIAHGAALFIGQTMADKAICDRGKMLSVLDYKDAFEEAGRKYGRVYYSRHPYVRDTDKEVMDYVRTCPFAEITSLPAYTFLGSERLSHIFGISSSILHEAKYFDLTPEVLFKPCFEYGSTYGKEYLSIYQKFVSPHFWSAALAPLMPTKPSNEVLFLDGKDKLRDMLGFYWSYHHIDKNEMTRRNCWEQGQRLEKLEKHLGAENLDQPSASPAPAQQSHKEIFRNVDVISFDLFDTLIERPYDDPNVIFDFMTDKAREITGDRNLDFRKEREQTRHLVKQKKGDEEITLDRRYLALCKKKGWNEDVADKLSALEMETELSFCKAKRQGKELFLLAQNLNKKTVITSDTFFPRSFIEKLLKKAGYDNYAGLFLSSEENKLKKTGNLYDVLIRRLRITSDKICHVGDDPVSDILKAHEYGIRTIHIPATGTLFQKPSRLSPFYKKGTPILASVIRWNIGKKWQDNPQISCNKNFTNGTAEFLAYGYIAPFLFGFAKWLVEEAIKDKIEHLYFLSRDGEVVKKCYDIISKHYPNSPKSHYIYASSHGVIVPLIKNKRDIKNVLSLYFSTARLGEILLHRLGIENVSPKLLNKHGFICLNDKISQKHSLKNLLSLAEEIAPEIYEKSRKSLEALTKYYQKEGLCSDNKNAVVDIGHRGSLQQALSRICKNKSLKGYYFSTHSDIKTKNISFKSYLPGFYNESMSRKNTNIYEKNLIIYEACFLNNDGSFRRILGEEPLMFSATENKKQIEFTQTIHCEAVRFCKDVTQIMQDKLWDADWPAYDAILPLSAFLSTPSKTDALLFSGLEIENFFSGIGYRFILFYNPANADESVRLSLWKEGAQILSS